MSIKNPPLYNLDLAQALVRIGEEIVSNSTQKNTPELQGMTPDQAYDVGYETCLRDLQSLTGPDPLEVGVIVFQRTEEPS